MMMRPEDIAKDARADELCKRIIDWFVANGETEDDADRWIETLQCLLSPPDPDGAKPQPVIHGGELFYTNAGGVGKEVVCEYIALTTSSTS